MNPSGTYNHLIQHAMPHVLIALNQGRKCSFWMGDKDAVARIDYAIKQIKNCEIMYSDECVAGMNKTQDECNQYGAD